MNDDLQRLRHAIRFRENPRDRMLELLEAVGTHPIADVLRDAAVAAEGSQFVSFSGQPMFNL